MIFRMAWRNIWRNKTRSFVIMLSVAIGLLAGIAVLSLYKGMMKSRVRTVIDAETTHLQVHHPEFKKDYHPSFLLENADDIIDKIRSNPAVRLVAPRVVSQGMLVTPTGSAGVQINGVVPELEYEMTSLKKKIIEGEGFHTGKKNEILIGKKLADKMKVKLASKLVLTFTDSSDNIVSSAFRVAAIYKSDNAPLDEMNVYVTINTLNELLLTGNGIHEIAITLHNDDNVGTVQEQLQKEFPSSSIESWKELSPETDLMVKTVDQYSYIIILIILIALAFGILNTMLMSILERTREIGMMVALGTSRPRVFLLVLTETILLSIAGTPVGILVAYLLINHYNIQGLDFSGFREEMMSSFGFNTMIYPVFPWEKLTTILLMVVGIAILSSLIPAIKALRLRPVEALRR